ncbi:hypothetical protein TUN_48230 [Bacillus sp. M21]|nr:hypothetical protein TUN_48230 [Bacillus sp. M21]
MNGQKLMKRKPWKPHLTKKETQLHREHIDVWKPQSVPT